MVYASEGDERQLASPDNRLNVHGLRLMSAGHNRGGLLLQRYSYPAKPYELL